MNIITKRVKNIFDEKKVKKNRKNILQNTINFSKNHDIKLLDFRIDFLTLKIQKSYSIILNIENNLLKIYDIDDIKNISDLNLLTNKLILFNKYYVLFTWYAFWEQKKIYSILDIDKNKIWQIILKNDLIQKKNKNVLNYLEFKWLFFKCHSDDLNLFLDYFSINKNQMKIVSRLDYCLDILWIEVHILLQYLKELWKYRKNVNALTATDKRKIYNSSDIPDKIKTKLKNKKDLSKKDYDIIINSNIDIKYWIQTTYTDYKSSHNDFKVYDKILDILDNYLKRKVNWVNPYQSYIDSELPITRIEVKKKKFDDLTDSSLFWLQDNIQKLFFDHISRYLNIDLSLYIWTDISLNWKKIFLAKEKKQKSLYHSMIMARAYLENIKLLSDEDNLYKFIYESYPELENIKPLDLMSVLDVSDLFIWIN